MSEQFRDKSTITSIKEALLGGEYEHPFRWKPDENIKEITPKMFDAVCSKLKKYVQDDIQFEHLMLYVVQSYLYTISDRMKEAHASLERAEMELKELTNDPLNNTSMYYDAFLHIVRSMKTHLLLMQTAANEDVIVSEIMSSIPPISRMDNQNRAAIYGLRAILCGEFGIRGFTLAVDLLSKAIEINQDESSWHYFKAKFLSQIRHIERPGEHPSKKEMYHLEFALAKKRSGAYTLLLARELQENGKRRPHSDSAQMNKQSKELYIESLDLASECFQTMFRCALGFMKFPPPFQDVPLAKKILEKGLRLSPDDGFGNHVMAQYCEKFEKNLSKAMEHLRICEEQEIFGAVLDLIRLEYQVHGKKAKVEERLKSLLNIYNENLQRCNIFGTLSSYYLLTLHDLLNACHYASEICRLNGHYNTIKWQILLSKPKLTTKHHLDFINLHQELMERIKRALRSRQYSSAEREYLKAFLQHLSSPNKLTIPEKPKHFQSDSENISGGEGNALCECIEEVKLLSVEVDEIAVACGDADVPESWDME